MRAIFGLSLAGLLLGGTAALNAAPLELGEQALDSVAAGQFNCLALGCPGSPPPLPGDGPFLPGLPGGLPGIGLGPILSPIGFLPRPPSGQPLQPQICPPLCGQGFPFPRLFGPVPLQ